MRDLFSFWCFFKLHPKFLIYFNFKGLCRTASFGNNGMAPIVPMQMAMPQQISACPQCKCCPQFVMQKQIVNRVPMPMRVPTPTVPRVLFTRKRCCCRRTYVL